MAVSAKVNVSVNQEVCMRYFFAQGCHFSINSRQNSETGTLLHRRLNSDKIASFYIAHTSKNVAFLGNKNK